MENTINFNEVYKEEVNNITYFFVSRIRDLQTSQELANDTMLKFNNAIINGLYDSKKSQVKTFLYNIAKNVLIDFYRSKKEQVSHIEDYISDNGENIFSSVYSEDRYIEEKEFNERVHSIFSTLSFKEKKIFVLRFVRGYKSREISAMLKINDSTVRVWIKRLKEKLEPQKQYLMG